MVLSAPLILEIGALICFSIATFRVQPAKIDLVALGLALAVLSVLL